MLKIKSVPIADLRPDGAMDPYAKDLTDAFEDLVANSGEPLEDQTKAAILAQIVRWSYEGSESFASWKIAVRTANNLVTQGGLLGSARMGEAKLRNEVKFTMAMDSVNWANCGKTAANLLHALTASVPGLADAIKVAQPTSYAAGAAADLNKVLRELPTTGTVLLFDCSLPDVHTFLVEVHPNGARYICQGYQSTYFANWWTDKNDQGLILATEKIPQEDVQRLFAARQDYGRGMIIGSGAYLAMLDSLAAALDASAITTVSTVPVAKDKDKNEDVEYRQDVLEYQQAWAAFASFWLKLPFCPLQREVLSIRSRGGRPTVLVTRYAIADPSRGTATSCTVPLVPEVIKN